MKRFVFGLLVVLAVIVSQTAPAAAHATLVSTDPIGGATLGDSPNRVTLRFSEAVGISTGSIRLYDQAGDRLRTDPPRHVDDDPHEVGVTLPHLPRGSYVVTWRVVSADSHPVRGAFTFRFGDAPATETRALTERLLAAEGGSTEVGAAFGVVRLLGFVALAVLIGGGVFLLVLWPAAFAERQPRRILMGAWVGATLTTAAAIPFQGVYAAGLDLADLARSSVISDVLTTRFGVAWLTRLVLLVAAGPLLAAVARSRNPARAWPTPVLALIAAGVVATPGIAGHAGVDHPAVFTVAVDAVHLGAACVWVGGLILLVACVLRRPVEDVVALVRRFSTVALAAVVVILVTGTFQAWRQSRSLAAVKETTYGQLVIAKLLLFGALIGLAALSRQWVRNRTTTTGASLGRLRASVAAEVAVAAIVFAVTAVLVNTVPARTALAQPLSAALRMRDVLVELTVDPAKAGPVDVHVYTVTPAGAITDVAEMKAELTLPGRDIGPLGIPLQRAGPGHLAAYGFDIPLPGEWEMRVTARTSDINQESATTPVRVR